MAVSGMLKRFNSNNKSSNPILYSGLLLIILIFLFGGSSRPEVPGLIVLRPFAIILVFLLLVISNRSKLAAHRSILMYFGAVFFVCVCHLIPLPPDLWRALPGREIQAEIMDATANNDAWLPLAMAPSHAINALYSLFVPLSVVMVMITLSYADQQKMMLLVLVLLAVSAMIGVLQAGGASLRLYAVSSTNSGLFANRNHQAVGLIILLMLGVYLIYSPRKPLIGSSGALLVLSVIFSTMIATLVMVTGSRLGLLLLPISLILLFWILHSKSITEPRSTILPYKYILPVFAVLALLFLGFIVASYSRNEAYQRLASTAGELRFDFWRQVWEFMPNYLPWGSGVGSYAAIYQLHEPDSLLNPGYSNHAHNEWLEVALTVGYPGIALMLSSIALFFHSIFVVTRSPSTHKRARLGFAVMIVFAIASVVDYPLRTPALSSIFAMAWVWVCHGRNAAKEVRHDGIEA